MSPPDDLTRPEVLGVTPGADEVALELRVPRALRYFRGHFPAQSILPGLIQVAWAAEFGQEYLQAGTELVRLEALKFSRIVRPEARLSLVLGWSIPQRCLSFHYAEGGRSCSSGRFIFAA